MPSKHGRLKAQFFSEYTAWRNMHYRCNDPRSSKYKHYGARGIKVSVEFTTFESFLRYLGPKPSPTHSIERINNDGDYSPENVKWATAIEQANNRRYNPLRTVQKRSRSGLTGVAWHANRQVWQAYGISARKPVYLYAGTDFFEACCRRKAWERANV